MFAKERSVLSKLVFKISSCSIHMSHISLCVKVRVLYPETFFCLKYVKSSTYGFMPEL